MSTSPYQQLPSSAFWKTGVAYENPYSIRDLYLKKFDITTSTRIATAGSCFAQHLHRHLKAHRFNILDLEPPPPGLDDSLHSKYGYSTFSARYGNIYTLRHFLQLAKEAAGDWRPANWIWEKEGRFIDALRPGIEPVGLESIDSVVEHRSYHLLRVRELLISFDLLIFTLGLTEAWVDRESGTVYPTAPGVIGGTFDEQQFSFVNLGFEEIACDFRQLEATLAHLRNGRPYTIILTVSPVPLTASASGQHILVSSSYSKSVLRAVAGDLSSRHSYVDYFPSYEIVTNPRLHSTGYQANLRSVRGEAVANAMHHFFIAHPKPSTPSGDLTIQQVGMQSEDVQCEDIILENFGR
jgi:hypothetical protein